MKKISIITAISLIGIIFIALLLAFMGFRVNLTDSIPQGLYRITSVGPFKNNFVIFCPDDRDAFKLARDRGYISYGLDCGGYGYLMKKVMAVTDDIISVTSEGVFVNHSLIPYSKPKLTDGMNRPLPQLHIFQYRLKENEVMTMTNQNDWSFDGRYYGLIHTGQIKGVIAPVWEINKRVKPT